MAGAAPGLEGAKSSGRPRPGAGPGFDSPGPSTLPATTRFSIAQPHASAPGGWQSAGKAPRSAISAFHACVTMRLQKERLFALTLPRLRSKKNEHSFWFVRRNVWRAGRLIQARECLWAAPGEQGAGQARRVEHAEGRDMPKLKPSTQLARREHILDAAERCFARSGFHRTTMQHICKEAGVSPGALYVYFDSKEALIAGIAERDRKELAEGLRVVGEADDLVAALTKLGEHYGVDEPHYKRVLVTEIGVESTRNPAVGEIYRSVDQFCLGSLESVFARAKASGRITSGLEPAALAQLVAVIGDGLFWRRAVHPDFDAKAMMPAIMQMVGLLLNPVAPGNQGDGNLGDDEGERGHDGAWKPSAPAEMKS